MQQQRRRSGIIIGLLALGLLAGMALTASPVQAVTGPGPYYAEPAWDRKMGASNRFLVLTNWNSEAVLDKETGLVWERTPDTTDFTWSGARFACINKNVGGRKGWRLPSIPELASLIDQSVGSPPKLPLGHPFFVESSVYWSASTTAENATIAWDVFFFNGDVLNHLKTDPFERAWCVRGGMNADAY